MRTPPEFEEYMIDVLWEVAARCDVSKFHVLGRCKTQEAMRARRIFINVINPYCSTMLLAALIGIDHATIYGHYTKQVAPEEARICEEIRAKIAAPTVTWIVPRKNVNGINRCPKCRHEHCPQVPYFPMIVKQCSKCSYQWRIR